MKRREWFLSMIAGLFGVTLAPKDEPLLEIYARCFADGMVGVKLVGPTRHVLVSRYEIPKSGFLSAILSSGYTLEQARRFIESKGTLIP